MIIIGSDYYMDEILKCPHFLRIKIVPYTLMRRIRYDVCRVNNSIYIIMFQSPHTQSAQFTLNTLLMHLAHLVIIHIIHYSVLSVICVVNVFSAFCTLRAIYTIGTIQIIRRFL